MRMCFYFLLARLDGIVESEKDSTPPTFDSWEDDKDDKIIDKKRT